MAARPSLLKMKVAFAKVNRDVSEVGSIIGGKVNQNINVLTPEQGRVENACAIRMSKALNYAGVKVPYIKKQNCLRWAGELVHLSCKRSDQLFVSKIW